MSDLTTQVVDAVKQGFEETTPSIGTLRMVDALADRVGDVEIALKSHTIALAELNEKLVGVGTKIDSLLALFGNIKFSGKAFLVVCSGLIGLVAVFAAIKTVLAWVGISIIKQ